MTTDAHDEGAPARAARPRPSGSVEDRAKERARGGAHPPPRGTAEEEFFYRRPLGRGDLLTAAGVAVGVGVAAFYVASLLLQRTPLDTPRLGRGGRGGGRSRRA